MPAKNNSSDAGIDLYSCGYHRIPPLTRTLIPTGVAWEFDWESSEKGPIKNFYPYMKIEGRSGNAVKKGMIILGGVIDEEYRGEIKVVIFNADKKASIQIDTGDKIAQGIVYLIPRYEIEETHDIDMNTERGKNGFGSTGS